MTATARQRAFTLIELIASMVIIGVIASVAVPLISAASDSYVTSSNNRDEVERVAHAMGRALRLLRAAPATGPGSGQPDITTAATSDIEFADGSELELIGTTLWLTPAGASAAPLCAGVTAFELEYIGEDGMTSTILTPENTQRIVIRIATSGQELRCAAFLRIATGSPAP